MGSEVDKRLVLGMIQAHTTLDEQESEERPCEGNQNEINSEESQAS